MHLLQDFRYGFRILIKSPAFAVVAVLTLAIGIGANTAIFSVVDAVLLRPLVMAEPDRVMLVTEVWRGIGGGDVSIGNFVDIRQQNDVFQQVSAMASARGDWLETRVSKEADADLPQTLVRLSQTQNAYQVALQSGARLLSTSLLDYLH